MKGLVWLASYPKSGNTWFRAFLTNYLRNADTPAKINDLQDGPMASAREPFDELVGYDSGEMLPEEIERLRPEVYLHQAREARETLYCKVHDAYTILPDGRPLFPPEATDRAIYIVRNPFDVCVSFAEHMGHRRYDRVIDFMANPDNGSPDEVDTMQWIQLRQRMLTWSGHVLSWADAPGLRVRVVRYEDLKLRGEETFGDCVKFLDLPFDEARLAKAIAFSRFEQLQAQEQEEGFNEKLLRASAFFRKGRAGAWRDVLTPTQAARIIADHETAMRRFGYLDERGEPVF